MSKRELIKARLRQWAEFIGGLGWVLLVSGNVLYAFAVFLVSLGLYHTHDNYAP